MTQEKESYILQRIRETLSFIGPVFATYIRDGDGPILTIDEIVQVARKNNIKVTPVAFGYYGNEDFVIGGTWFDIIHRDAQEGNDIYFADYCYHDNGTITKEAKEALKSLKICYKDINRALMDAELLDISVFSPFLYYVTYLYGNSNKRQLATKLDGLLWTRLLTDKQQEEFVEHFFELVDLIRDDLED